MFKYEKHSAAVTVRLAPVERVVEFTPGGMDADNIAKILSLAVDGRVISATAYDGYVEAEGRANFKLIYLDRDGTARGVDYNADFSVRLEGDVSAGDTVTAQVSVLEADAATGASLTLSAVISVSAVTVKRCEEEILVDAENCYKTLCPICLPSFVAAKSAVIPVEDEAAAGDVGAVLSLDSGVSVTSATAGENVVNVGFTVGATVTYVENGEIKTAEFDIDETEEISVDGALEGDVVVASASIGNGRVILAGVTGENVIRFEGDVTVKIQVFREKEIEAVKDMFMLTNEVAFDRAERQYVFPSGSKRYVEKVSGTVTLSEAANEIVAVPASRVYLAKTVVTEDGGAQIEGLVTADIVFTDENGLNSVRAEIPFSVVVSEDYSGELYASACVKSVTAKLKKGTEIDVAAELNLSVYAEEVRSASYVAAVTVGEAKEVNTSGLSLYVASEGDEMWDVCKALTATPEAIMEQNPALTAPLKEGEKVVYFRQLTL